MLLSRVTACETVPKGERQSLHYANLIKHSHDFSLSYFVKKCILEQRFLCAIDYSIKSFVETNSRLFHVRPSCKSWKGKNAFWQNEKCREHDIIKSISRRWWEVYRVSHEQTNNAVLSLPSSWRFCCINQSRHWYDILLSGTCGEYMTFVYLACDISEKISLMLGNGTTDEKRTRHVI